MTALLAYRLGALRFFSSSSQRLRNRVPEYQKLFQEDNGLPVHLKGGVTDALLYRFTMALSIFGTGLAIFQLLQASYPKQSK